MLRTIFTLKGHGIRNKGLTVLQSQEIGKSDASSNMVCVIK
jgi:hypothetical protein